MINNRKPIFDLKIINQTRSHQVSNTRFIDLHSEYVYHSSIATYLKSLLIVDSQSNYINVMRHNTHQYDLFLSCLHRIKLNRFMDNNCLMRATNTFGIKYCKILRRKVKWIWVYICRWQKEIQYNQISLMTTYWQLIRCCYFLEKIPSLLSVFILTSTEYDSFYFLWILIVNALLNRNLQD